MTHPEELSGIWETPDGHGGAVGIHLVFDTTVPVNTTTLVGVTQAWLGLQVGLYRRAGAEMQPSEENGFSDSPRGGNLRYENDHLTLHAPGYDLDLHRIAGDKWSGRFHRDDFDAIVTLARPALQPSSRNTAFTGTSFVGTWRGASGADTICLHIAEQSPSTYIAWSDTLRTLGSVGPPAQTTKAPYSWEHYGDLAKVRADGKGLSVELGAYNGICCPHSFNATSASSGKEMKAEWLAGANQSAHKSRWTKMPGNTCVIP